MVKFGTSGLRGLVTELNGPPASSYTLAFLQALADRGDLQPGGSVCVGRDLRASSPAIAARVMAAIEQAGYVAVDCGELPTPALSLHARSIGSPAIMVTGSHIPDDRNGLKFYRADGEITKRDEDDIVSRHRAGAAAAEAATQAVAAAPLPGYVRRYTGFFAAGLLAGLRVGVYQHSSALRDVLTEILAALGAEAVALGRSDRFVPVDTEAVHPDDVERLRGWARQDRFAAIVSGDGDADRPLIADETGRIVRGDAIGAIAAARLGAATIVTPMTSNSALEAGAAAVVRTAVGSPFVIEGIGRALPGGGVVVGFEANGGLILGSAVTEGGRTLEALPTRDAVLPILCCLAEVARTRRPLSAIAAALAFRPARADRLQEAPPALSAPFLAALPLRLAAQVAAEIGPLMEVQTADGVRFLSRRGEMVYFRASGNAPELRCYVEAPDERRADELLAWGLRFARRSMDGARSLAP